MNIDSSNRKIMTAGLVLLVVAGGLGIYMVADSFNCEEITETGADEAHQ